MSLTVASARQAVRSHLQDGLSADATPVPYNVARLEDLTDQVVAQATPTATQFLIRFESVAYEEHVTVYATPGTLAAYLDGSPSPTAPAVDVDRNGNFALPRAPASTLQVTYGWQLLQDADVDGLVDRARAWLKDYTDLTQIPDGLTPACLKYAAALGCRALQRKFTLADAKAGDASLNLSQFAKGYATLAKDLEAEALADRTAYSQTPERLAPAVGVIPGGLAIPAWQPKR